MSEQSKTSSSKDAPTPPPETQAHGQADGREQTEASVSKMIAESGLPAPATPAAVQNQSAAGPAASAASETMPTSAGDGLNLAQNLTGQESTGVRTKAVSDSSVEPDRQRTAPKLPADEFYPLSKRIPVQMFDHLSFGQKLGHLGPTLTSIFSIVLAFIVWDSAKNLNEKQVELQSKQTELQSQQVKAELADMRFKFLNDLLAEDESKKTPAELSLAAHGLDALPVVHFALGVEQGEVRKGAVNVVYRMFQAAPLKQRDELLTQLMAEFKSPNKTLHTGVMQSLVKLEPLFSSTEQQQVADFLQKNAAPRDVCSTQEGRELVKEAASFFRDTDARSLPYLTSVAGYPRCGDGWVQAMLKLEGVGGKLGRQQSAELLNTINQLESSALQSLREDVTDEDLESGGFAGLLPEGKLIPKFEEFSQKVMAEFARLKDFLRQ